MATVTAARRYSGLSIWPEAVRGTMFPLVLTLLVLVIDIVADPATSVSRPRARLWLRHGRSSVRHSGVPSMLASAAIEGRGAAERRATYGDDPRRA